MDDATIIDFQCPACQKKMKARPSLLGKRVKCPQCGGPALVRPGPPPKRRKKEAASEQVAQRPQKRRGTPAPASPDDDSGPEPPRRPAGSYWWFSFLKYDMLAAALFLAFVVYLLVHAQNKGSGGMDSRQQRHGLHVMEEFAAFTAAWFILTLVADRSMLKRWRIGFWLCCACLAITVVLRVNCVLFLWEHGQNRYPFNTTVLQMVRVVPMAAVLYAVAELGYHLLYLKVIWSIRQAHPRWPSRAEAETGSSGFAVAVWGIFAGVLIAATLWAVYLVTQGPFEAVELEVNPEPGVISRKTVRTSTYNPPFAIAPGVIAFVVCCVFLYKFMKWKRGEDDDWY